MLKIFKPFNLLLIVAFIVFFYIGYLNFSLNKDSERLEQPKDKNKAEIEENKNDHKTPEPKLKDLEIDKEFNFNKESGSKSSSFYKNKTYNYKITYPKDWPLTVRSKKNIAIGYIEPRNGVAAINIEVADSEKVIEKIKQEVKKNPENVSLSERDLFIDNFKATKYILNNKKESKKYYYILLRKVKHDYVIKYPAESKKFLDMAESVIDKFKFIN